MLQEESDTESDSDSDDSDEEDARRKRRGKNQNIPATRRFVNDLASIQLGVFQAMLRLAHSVRLENKRSCAAVYLDLSSYCYRKFNQISSSELWIRRLLTSRRLPMFCLTS
jgi:hypothetical protein